MTSLGQGSDEVVARSVPVLVRRLLRRACRAWRLGYRRTGRAASQPRPSGRDKPGDIAGEPKNRSEASLPGLVDWLLAAAAGLPTTVRLARSCSFVSAVAREARFSNFLPTLTELRRCLPTVLTNATSPGPDRQKTPAWRGEWRVVRPAPSRVAARAVGTR